MHVVVILIMFPENISMVFSMYRFGLHIGHLFPEENFRIYVHCCHIGHVFPEKILRVYRMYGQDCHIGHVFPDFFFFKILSMYGHSWHIGNVFPKGFPRFKACMGMVAILTMCFQK